ncbi:unnamed protein product [Amoebophrya sp. A120]|nr:unnamed protein product [Amoebophrya sp. A120]|eukprot:GSA120T00020694001.1
MPHYSKYPFHNFIFISTSTHEAHFASGKCLWDGFSDSKVGDSKIFLQPFDILKHFHQHIDASGTFCIREVLFALYKKTTSRNFKILLERAMSSCIMKFFSPVSEQTSITRSRLI